MIIIKIMGGLGNQMFQFAFAVKYILDKREVKFDVSHYEHNNSCNGFELSRIFKNINLPVASLRDVFYFVEKAKNENNELYFKLKENRSIIQEEKKSEFKNQPYLNNLDNVYFKGYWQNVHYFDKQSSDLVNFFRFPLIADDDIINQMMVEKIVSSNSVSIHIRRGDYITSPFHKVLEMDYYCDAIDLIKSRVQYPLFFIFSDDCMWAKKNIKENNAIFINNNGGENSYRDMQLMSLCKHNIIANSTFSWWPAWLNKNTKKEIISPRLWFNEEIEMKGLLLKDWIRI